MNINEVIKTAEENYGKSAEKIFLLKEERHRLCDGYVFDENKSVAWNREELERQRKKANAAIAKERDYYFALGTGVENAIRQYLKEDTGLCDAVIEKIMTKGYDDGHSAGYYEVFQRDLDYAEFAMSIIEASKTDCPSKENGVCT